MKNNQIKIKGSIFGLPIMFPVVIILVVFLGSWYLFGNRNEKVQLKTEKHKTMQITEIGNNPMLFKELLVYSERYPNISGHFEIKPTEHKNFTTISNILKLKDLVKVVESNKDLKVAIFILHGIASEVRMDKNSYLVTNEGKIINQK